MQSDSGLSRVRDDGSLVRTFDVSSLASDELTIGGLGPDGMLYLIAANQPAFSVVRLNPSSGELLDTLAAPFTGSSKLPSITHAYNLDFAPNGDVFILGSGPDPDGGSFGISEVHRIDRASGNSKSYYRDISPVGISDLAVRPASDGTHDAEVFITAGYGQLTHWLSSGVDESAPGNPAANTLPDSTNVGVSTGRQMEFGPDGALHLMTDLSQVWKFDLTSRTGHTIVSSIPNPFTPSIVSPSAIATFDGNGDFIVLRSGANGSLTNWHTVNYRFDGATGAFLGNVFSDYDSSLGEITDLVYLAVPEPASLLPLVFGIGGVCGRKKRRC